MNYKLWKPNTYLEVSTYPHSILNNTLVDIKLPYMCATSLKPL